MATTLSQILQLEQLDLNLFRSTHHKENFRQTLFGGQVLAQALKAAVHTANDRMPHSLHAYFLHAGSSKTPIIYDIEPLRDGRSISNRRVNARQNGRIIFTMTVSFHDADKGFHHQRELPCNIASPEELLARGVTPQNRHTLEDDQYASTDSGPFELLPVSQDNFTSQEALAPKCQFWMRSTELDATNQTNQLCALAFGTDFGLLATSLMPHPTSLFSKDILAASIDHALWFHTSEIDLSQWLLCDLYSPWAGAGRGFAIASIFTRDGQLVASSAQEGMIKQIER